MKKLLFFSFLLISMLGLAAVALVPTSPPIGLLVLAVLMLVLLVGHRVAWAAVFHIAPRSFQDKRYTGQPPAEPGPDDAMFMRFLVGMARLWQMLTAPLQSWKHRSSVALIAA